MIIMPTAAKPSVFEIITCADPESFVRGGPTLTTYFWWVFLVHEGGRIQMPI